MLVLAFFDNIHKSAGIFPCHSRNRNNFLEIIKLAKELMPDITLTTDIIVGFPTETREDFDETLSILKEVGYDSIFSFIYSKREGTKAAEWDNVSTEEEIESRFQEMLEVENAVSLERNKRHEGMIEKVLVEGESKNDPGMLTGRTEGNKIVLFDGCDTDTGNFVELKITRADTFALYGEK